MSDLKFLNCVRKMPLMELPVCSVVVPLKSARILISPGSQLTVEQLKEAGEVTDIVAPNLLHCAGMKQAAAVFPEAKLWGPQGVREAKPEIGWTHILGEDKWPFEDELKLLPLNGLPRFNESEFYHVSSKTLIVTDLLFNLQDARGVGAYIILNMFGTYRRFAMSKLFARFVTNKFAFEKSMTAILNTGFENIVVSHGQSVKADASVLLSLVRERGFLV